MSKLSNYPNGFKNGITLRNQPLYESFSGSVYYADSNGTGADTTNYGTFDEPFLTINYAASIASAGDFIYAKAGHVESITAAAALAFLNAGITVVFLGEGSNKATIDFGTAVGADMDIDAANITLVSPRFTASIDALTGPIDVNAANFTMIDAEYVDGSSIDTTDCVIATAAATGLKILGFKYVKGDEGGTQKQSFIQLNGVDNAVIEDIHCVGDFGTGIIENVTDEVLNVRFKDIYIWNTNSTPKPGIVIDANAEGLAENVFIRVASGTTYVSSVGEINWVNCLGFNADGETGDPIGTADSAGVEGKIDAVNTNLGASANEITTDSINGKIGTDAEMADHSLIDHITGKDAYFAAGLGYRVATATPTDIFDGTSDKSLFTVSGGKILLTAIWVETSGATVDNTTSNLTFSTNPTVGTDAALSTNLDIDSDEVGSIYSITAVGSATTGGSGGGATTLAAPIIIDVGTICIDTSADAGTGGALGSAVMYYIPLESGASVAAAF